MRPTLACGHTEYDRGHCGYETCENDYRRCQQCNPAAFPEPGPGWASGTRKRPEATS